MTSAEPLEKPLITSVPRFESRSKILSSLKNWCQATGWPKNFSKKPSWSTLVFWISVSRPWNRRPPVSTPRHTKECEEAATQQWLQNGLFEKGSEQPSAFFMSNPFHPTSTRLARSTFGCKMLLFLSTPDPTVYVLQYRLELAAIDLKLPIMNGFGSLAEMELFCFHWIKLHFLIAGELQDQHTSLDKPRLIQLKGWSCELWSCNSGVLNLCPVYVRHLGSQKNVDHNEIQTKMGPHPIGSLGCWQLMIHALRLNKFVAPANYECLNYTNKAQGSLSTKRVRQDTIACLSTSLWFWWCQMGHWYSSSVKNARRRIFCQCDINEQIHANTHTE